MNSGIEQYVEQVVHATSIPPFESDAALLLPRYSSDWRQLFDIHLLIEIEIEI